MSCKAMFEKVNSIFQKGIADHTIAAQQQFESVHSPLASALRYAINSASLMTQTLSREFADSHRQLLALGVSGENSQSTNPLSNINNGSLLHEKIESLPNPTKDISKQLGEHKYKEAFTEALQMNDVSIFSW
uniref:Uncharacterized protein n=1 Tax=Solanum lycopersicum TaxID=4081 RepID=A0A3Q7H6S8_SOLLC